MMTAVWGPGHIEWFEKACIRSLCWPKNNASLKQATWHLFTRPQDEEKVKKAVEKVGVKQIRIHHLPSQLEGMPRQMGLILLDVFKFVIKDCLETNAQLLTAPPDTIFSEGTIPNLINLAKFGDTCVAVPHPRVNASVFGSIKDDPVSSKELVRLAFKHQHKAWSSSEIGADNQGTFVGGIAWQKVQDNLWAVQHMLPTLYLCSFTQTDWIFFNQRFDDDGSERVYGAFDHLWPSELVREQRQRTPGSSDACCIVEVTKEELNVPQKVQSNPLEPDAFWRGALHNRMNRQYLYMMSGE